MGAAVCNVRAKGALNNVLVKGVVLLLSCLLCVLA
jgi:hypothetical protein